MLFLISALDGVVVNAKPRPLYSRERSGAHCIGGRVGPRAGLDGYGKSRPPPGFDPRTVQLVASRYTNCAIPALPVGFTPGKIPDTHCTGGCVGSRPVCERSGKSRSQSVFELQTVQPVASRYTD